MPPTAERFDSVIIGGGPGGAAAATLLAQAGLRVAVLEREHFPRPHVGESLLPDSRRIFRRLGVLDAIDDAARFVPKRGALFYDAAGELTQEFRFADALGEADGRAWQVERAVFDEVLLRNAAAAGADVREGWRVERVRFDGRIACGVAACDPDGHARTLDARLVIDASGRDTLLAGQLGLRRPHPRLRKGALYSYYRGVPRPPGDAAGHVHIVQLEAGWAWVIPLAQGVASVGLVLHRRALKARGGEPLEAFFARVAAGHPVLAGMLAGATREGPVYGMSNLSYTTTQCAGPGWALVGDAAVFVDPVFSTGVHLALMSAELVADDAAPVLARGAVPGAAHFERYSARIGEAHRLLFPFVEGFYDPAFFRRFLTPVDTLGMRSMITSLLAGDVSRRWRRLPLLWLFWLGVRRMRTQLAAEGQATISTVTD